ncbi:MAG: sulfatase/phosphatase domain-containing protein, partial [Planctomycetota bacterium]
NFLPMYPQKLEMGCYGKPVTKNGVTKVRILRDENLAPFPRTEYAIRVNRQEYYALITHMDEQIGRILAALDATGKRDNTYIFFTADHGLACGQHGLLGKQNMYDHSMRVPFIVVGPDVPKNEQRDAPIYMQDVMPTALDLAKADKPKHVEFQSLVPLIKDANQTSQRSELYGCYLKDKQRMVRVGDWKLIVYPQAEVLKLFDLSKDPHEMNDLSKLPEHQGKVDELYDQLVKLQEKMDDPMDLTVAFPRKAAVR